MKVNVILVCFVTLLAFTRQVYNIKEIGKPGSLRVLVDDKECRVEQGL